MLLVLISMVSARKADSQNLLDSHEADTSEYAKQ